MAQEDRELYIKDEGAGSGCIALVSIIDGILICVIEMIYGR